MFQNHVGQPEATFPHFYNNPVQPASYPQNNPTLHGRHTPLMPQQPNNLIPPPQPGPPGGPPSMIPTWNGGFNVPQPHQQPTYNPLPNMHQNHPGPPPNLINHPPNRHQFNPQPTPVGNPFQQPPIYGHHPTSQFVMPMHQFQGGVEVFHQGYVMAGGPFSAHQNEMFYQHQMPDHRQMPSFVGPPLFNPRPPMHHIQQGVCPLPTKQDALSSSFVDVCGQYGIEIPVCRKSYCEQIREFKPVFPDEDDIDLNHIVCKPVQSSHVNQPHVTHVTREFYTNNSSRMNTPSECILEQNTCFNFDESSEELAEIFGSKSSSKHVNSRASSKTSSMRTNSSDCIYYSEDENYNNVPTTCHAMDVPIRNYATTTKSNNVHHETATDNGPTLGNVQAIDNLQSTGHSKTRDNIPTMGYHTAMDNGPTMGQCSKTMDNVPNMGHTANMDNVRANSATMNNVPTMGHSRAMDNAKGPTATMDNAPVMGHSTIMHNTPMMEHSTAMDGIPTMYINTSEDGHQSNCHNDKHAPRTPPRPPPGFAHIQTTELPPEDQLNKVGHYIKGLLKMDGKAVNSSRTSPHEGNTIRSLIQQPIYSNCESRLKIQEPEIKPNKTRKSEHTAVLNSAHTGQTRYIQKITSHFRILFEPIPDMFDEEITL